MNVFKQHLRDMANCVHKYHDDPKPKIIIVDLSPHNHVDASFIHGLIEIDAEIKEAGVMLLYSHFRQHIYLDMVRVGLVKELGEKKFIKCIDECFKYAQTVVEQELAQNTEKPEENETELHPLTIETANSSDSLLRDYKNDDEERDA